MSDSIPHYLLLSESRSLEPPGRGAGLVGAGRPSGQWRFVLESVDDTTVLDVCDEECEADLLRLELLAVIRGLESLDQPSRVTLVTSSRSVHHGLRYGLTEWRENDWQWERFGEMVPIRNADLWRRLDRILRYHRVECRSLRFDRGSPAHANHPSDGGDWLPRPHFSMEPGREPQRATH